MIEVVAEEIGEKIFWRKKCFTISGTTTGLSGAAKSRFLGSKRKERKKSMNIQKRWLPLRATR
jgi:hypothetical protein